MKVLEWKDKTTGKEFYDYRTGRITGDNIFDTSTTGVSYYNELLPGSSEENYYRNQKNLVGEIIYLTPEQYFENCVKYAFPNSSVEKLKKERSRDTESLETIRTVIDNNVQLPMTMINAAAGSQEGLHRMYVVGEDYGWNNKKYPVLFIDYYNKNLQKEVELNKRKNNIEQKIKQAVLDACEYKYNSFEQFVNELRWTLNNSFRYFDEFEDFEDVPFKIEKDNDLIIVTVLDVSFIFNISDINITNNSLDDSEEEINIDDLLVDDIDIYDLLKKLK